MRPDKKFRQGFNGTHVGFPGGSDSKESACNAGDPVRSLGWEDPWRREWQPTPVFLAGKSDEQRSLVGYSPWGRKDSDTTEWLTLYATARGNKNKKQIPLLTPWVGWAGFLNGVRVGVDQWVRLGGGLGGLPICLGGPVCRDHVWYSAFALAASEAAVGFWPFCILLFIIALSVYDWSYFYSFFLFYYLRRHLSRSKCKHSGRGSQVVPAILTSSGAWELTCTSFQNPVCILFPIPPAVTSH